MTNVHATRLLHHLGLFLGFGEQNDITLFMYKFHKNFDGLLGFDLLDAWDSNSDPQHTDTKIDV